MSMYRFVQPAEGSVAFDKTHWLMDDFGILMDYGVLVEVPFDEAVERMARADAASCRGPGHWENELTAIGRQPYRARMADLLVAALGEEEE